MKQNDTNKKIWDVIKEQVKISDLVSLENNTFECPQHGNESGKSAQFYQETETWTCHKCKVTGDSIKLYQIQNNISERKEAISKMVLEYKIETTELSLEQIEKKHNVQEIHNDFMNKCYEHLKKSTKYYDNVKLDRDFSDETMKEFKIGLFDSSIKRYMEEKYSIDDLKEAGFLKTKTGKWAFAKRIAYPYLDSNGENAIYFIFRAIKTEPDFSAPKEDKKGKKTGAKYYKLYTKNKEYIDNQLYGLNSLAKYPNKSLIITEGVTDTISVIQANFPCLSPITTQFRKVDFLKISNKCKRFKKIIIINDNDIKIQKDTKEILHPGKEGAEKSLQLLLEHGHDVYIGEIPNPEGLDKIDLDDYLKGTHEDREKLMQDLVDNAKEGLEYLIEKLPEKPSNKEFKQLIKIVMGDSAKKVILRKVLKKKYSIIAQLYKEYETEIRNEIKEEKEKEIKRNDQEEKNKINEIKKNNELTNDLYWDDRVLPKEKYNLRTWGSKDGFLWRRDEKLHLLDWDTYRKISKEEANFLGVPPREEQMTKSLFIAKKIEDSRIENMGVAPILYCKNEQMWYEHLKNEEKWRVIKEDVRFFEIVGDRYTQEFENEVPDVAMTRAIIHRYKLNHMIKEDEAFCEISKIKGQIPLINGILVLNDDFTVKELRDYTPRDFFTEKINCVYDPEAQCPNIHKFLKEIMNHHKGDVDTQRWIDRLLGFTADLLLPGNIMEWILYLLGEGQNGKGVYTQMIHSLLGEKLISHINWDGFDMTNDNFAIFEIVNKWANVCSESDSSKIKTNLVKNISGNDPIQIRNLNKSPISYRPLAKLIFIDNMAVNIPKSETAIWRRIITVTFPNDFSETENSDLKSEDGILAQEIKSGGFLNLLLNYLPLEKRLAIKKEALTDSHDLFTDFSERKIAIYQFLDDAVLKSKEGTDYITSDQIWILYKIWYRLHRGVFPKELKNKAPTRAIGGKISYWIKLKSKEGYFERDFKPQNERIGQKRIKTCLKVDKIFLAELQYEIIEKLLEDENNWDIYSEVLDNEFIPINIRDQIETMKQDGDFYQLERIKYFQDNYNEENVLKINQLWQNEKKYTKITENVFDNIIIETKEIKDNKERVIARFKQLHKEHGDDEYFTTEDILVEVKQIYSINEDSLNQILKWLIQQNRIERKGEDFRLTYVEKLLKPKEEYEGLLLKL